jgi:hypothetical protein
MAFPIKPMRCALPICCVLVAACSTDPDHFSYRPLAISNVLTVPAVDPATAATITVRLEPSGMGSIASYFVRLDDVRLASMSMGEAHTFSAPLGEHTLTAECLRPLGTAVKRTIAIDLKPGRAYFYRIYNDDSFCLIEPRPH